MTPRAIPDVIAVTPGGDITLDMLIGFIVLYSVPDEPVSLSKFRSTWTKEGLDEKLVPDSRRPVDAFRAACRSVERKRKDATGSRREEVSVDQVLLNGDECVYQITRLVRDEKERVIDHPKSMRVVFKAKTETIRAERLDDEEHYKRMKPLADRIKEHYAQNADRVPGSKVRQAVRAVLDAQMATNIAGKAAYFVPKGGKGHLDSIEAVLGGLYGQAATWHSIPCANAESERNMVERHFAVSVSDDVNEIMAEIAERLKSDKTIRSDRYGRLLQQRKQLQDRAKEYAKLLGTEQDEVGVKLQLLNAQIDKLAEKLA